MAATLRTPPYKRKVSFDSLSPHVETDPDEPLHIPPQYLNTETEAAPSRLDLAYGFDTGARAADIDKVFHSFQEVSRPGAAYTRSYKSRKVPKLPSAQGKSILKSRPQEYVLSPSQADYGVASSIPRTTLVPAASLNPRPKKKSIVDMTPEELMQMDQQFRKAVDPESLKFGGDEYLPAAGKYAGLTSLESRRASQVKNIEGFVGTKMNNRNVLTPSLMNYNSFVANYRHEKMSQFITDHYTKAVHSTEERSRLVEGSPMSLRDILVYISGRHHTWAALDWAISNMLENGDNLVLICQVPEFVAVDPLNKKHDGLFEIDDDTDDDEDPSGSVNDYTGSDKTNNKRSDDNLLPPYEYVDVDQHYGCEGIEHQADRLLKYMFKKLDECGKKDIKVSFTVELIKEKKVSTLLKKAVALHSPQVMITSSLVTHQMYSQVKPLRLPFYISSKLSVPTVIVPYRFIDAKCLNPKNDADVQSYGVSIKVEHHDEVASDGTLKSSFLIDRLNFFTDSLPASSGEDSFPSSRSDSPSRSTSSAGTPTDYLGPNSKLSIKFADSSVHPSGPGSVSHSLGSRRNSSHSTGMYKVKSLLDSEPLPAVARSKSQTTPLSSAISNGSSNHLEKTSTKNTLRKSKSEPQEEKKGFLGLFRKKKK